MNILDHLFSLHGRTALVTGGASGIGRMCAEALVRAGASVMIASRKGTACAAVAAELNALGAPGKAEGFAGDVATDAGVKALARDISVRTERLDILVNNAGRSWGEPMDTFPFAAWESVMALNVAGLFTLTRDLLPLLRVAATPDAPARVVNLGSVMGTLPLGDGAYSYAASKAAVHHLTRILAKELAPAHITVNAFAPGPFASKMTAFATADERRREKVARVVPLRRIGSPEDIAGALLYVCGRGGSYITGAVLPIDGGLATSIGEHLFPEAE